jgi:hypothetical protein
MAANAWKLSRKRSSLMRKDGTIVSTNSLSEPNMMTQRNDPAASNALRPRKRLQEHEPKICRDTPA